jgi:hypothetical protein
MQPTVTLARRLWQAIEPFHAVVYFAPEPAEAARSVGLRGWWMGYFAGRVAPLGPIPPEAVTAVTYGFSPAMVRRAIPDAWRFAPPEQVLPTRLEAVGAALRRALTGAHLRQIDQVRGLLWEAVDGCRFEARPLAAAWSSVARPDDPIVDCWLAATVLREHRGDGHVLAAVSAGLRGLDASVTHVATGAITRDIIQPSRGWSDDEWDQSCRRLRARGLLDRDGRPTRSGGTLRREIEDTTDRLAAGPVERLGETGIGRVVDIAGPISRHLIDIGVVPVPNPIGVPRP